MKHVLIMCHAFNMRTDQCIYETVTVHWSNGSVTIMQQTCVFKWVQSAQCKALQYYSVAITLPLFQSYKAFLSPCELAARDIHCAKSWRDGWDSNVSMIWSTSESLTHHR